MRRMSLGVFVGLMAYLWAVPVNGSGIGLGAHYSLVHNQSSGDNSNMLGVQVRLRNSVIGIEGAIDYRNEDQGNGVALRSWPITASLLVYPISPVYALAGLGWYNTTLDFPSNSPFQNDTQTAFGYHLGAGLEVPVAPTLKLFGDMRWQFVNYEFADIPSSIGKVDADSYSFNAGFLFYLR